MIICNILKPLDVLVNRLFIMDNKTFVNVLDRIYGSLNDSTDLQEDLRDIACKVNFSDDDITPEDVEKFPIIIKSLYREHCLHIKLCNSVHDLMVSVRDYNL